MNEPRVTAYWYASRHGLPCDLEYLAEFGLRAACHARWLGILEAKVPEGPYLVHTWPEHVFGYVTRFAAPPRDLHCPRCNYDTHRCPGCGEPLPHGTEACAGCHEDDCVLRGAYGPDEMIPPWIPLPQGDQALRSIGY